MCQKELRIQNMRGQGMFYHGIPTLLQQLERLEALFRTNVPCSPNITEPVTEEALMGWVV